MATDVESSSAPEWLASSRIAKVVTDHWVKDLEATVKDYSDKYGLGPWKVAELKAPLVKDVQFRGEPGHIEFLAAMTEVGPLAVEVLQVVGGSDAVLRWADELPDRYWHFVSYHRERDDALKAHSALLEHGFTLVLNGQIDGSLFFMFDRGDLFGRMFEVAGGDLSRVAWEPFRG
ncbi:MAG TPA: hypothetical protein VGF23_06325 [Gaiellaceae bacterium]|jgi:hypothetical protein